jgi:sucrose phosphorylase
VAQTGQKRAINRQRLDRDHLEAELQGGLRQMIFDGYRRLLHARTTEPAFHPYGQQQVLALHPAVFALQREHDGQSILCLHNVSSRPVTVMLPFPGLDLLLQRAIDEHSYQLPPYGVLWSKRL